MRTVETTSFTVCAGHALTWCHPDGKTVRVMTARDSSVLMGFPPSWRLPKGSRVSQRAVGNAVCVAMSKAVTLAAIAVLNGDAAVITPPPMPQTIKKRTIAEVSRGEYDALRQRVEELEESLSPCVSNLIVKMTEHSPLVFFGLFLIFATFGYQPHPRYFTQNVQELRRAAPARDRREAILLDIVALLRRERAADYLVCRRDTAIVLLTMCHMGEALLPLSARSPRPRGGRSRQGALCTLKAPSRPWYQAQH